MVLYCSSDDNGVRYCTALIVMIMVFEIVQSVVVIMGLERLYCSNSDDDNGVE